MGETTHFHHHHQQPPPTTASSRLGLRSAGGEIVEVQGGHIVRSTGRKDRHSKVCTAKGPRDRRVRLSAHTAIQFYDVQDRLGYDRPSKAVDWLIKKAKAAIDELAELPAWKPTNTTPAAASAAAAANFDQQEPPPEQNRHHQIADNENHFHHQQQLQMGENDNSNNHNNSSSFLPPSMDSDSIADTIKSFFPMGANSTANPNSSSSGGMQFQSFPPPDLLSRTSSQSQDLRLSLQSFQDPIHFHQNNHHQNDQPNHHNLFSGPTNLGFDWAENGGGFQRMVGFGGGGGGGGEMFSGPMQTPPFLQPLFGHQSASQFYTTQQQRGPLQSSNTPPVRAWIDPMSAFSAAGLDHQQQQTLAFHHHHPQQHGGGGGISGFASSAGGGFSGFRIPARIQGDEEEHDGISDKPSSASSDSRH